jgi:hypothetical protein
LKDIVQCDISNIHNIGLAFFAVKPILFIYISKVRALENRLRKMTSSIEYPPGPHSMLPNKLLRKFIHNPLKTLMDITCTYGGICHFQFGRQHVYLVNNPHYIEDILIRNYKNFIKSRGLQVTKRLLGEGLVTSEGEYHDYQ